MSRDGLERLAAVLGERIGTPCEHGEDSARVEPLRRQVRHAVTGVDAYLGAVETGSRCAAGLRKQALDLWESLERIASSCPGHGTTGTDGEVPAKPAPLL